MDGPMSVETNSLLCYDNHTHKVENRIVSLSQPHLRPIVRGKTKAPVEFGAKLDISVVDGVIPDLKKSPLMPTTKR